MPYRIFVVDDDQNYARMLSYRLDKNPDYSVKVFNSGEDVLKGLSEKPDLILLDIMMPGIDGITVLKEVVSKCPGVPVIMVSAQGIIDTAVESMKIGAYDYITKGQDDLVKLDTIVKHVLEKVSMERELDTLRKEVTDKYKIKGLIGDSAPMQQVYHLIHKAVRGDLTVAVHGESGTGKELVAKAIHFNSNRKRGPFVVVNCAAIARELMESEFFGHEKGSFTGAHARKIGKFEQANGGTIFLDEIGELNLDLQAKLLRALQEGELQRVGGNDTIDFDARVISATNQDVLRMIRDGKFREDLYYRLFQYPIPLPPLRERGQDMLLLTNYFFREYVTEHQDFKEKTISAEARRAITNYSWPGNVRELKSAIERGILISDSDAIMAADLMINTENPILAWEDRFNYEEELESTATTHSGIADFNFEEAPQPEPDNSSTNGTGSYETPNLEPLGSGDGQSIVSLEELKHRAVEHAYRRCEGNVDRAAVELGIGRATMYRLLKKYQLMS